MCDESRSRDGEYKVYLEERAKLIQSKAEETHKFDKAILTLASGAFGFSLVFIKEIVPCIRDGTFLWILASWVGFGFSLLSTLISFLVSQSACQKQIEIVENEFLGEKKQECQRNKAASWTFGLNVTSITAFILGVIFLVVFVSINMHYLTEQKMSKKKEAKKVIVQFQGGYYPQSAPLIKGVSMADDKKRKIDEGFVPQKLPSRPLEKEDKGFVPQPPPRKPEEKPDKGKK